jgi:predicted DNA-binding protein
MPWLAGSEPGASSRSHHPQIRAGIVVVVTMSCTGILPWGQTPFSCNTCLLFKHVFCYAVLALNSSNQSTYTDVVATPRRTFVEKQVSFRMQLATWQRLQATAAALDHSQAQIINDALEAYFAALPAKDRQLIETILARRQKP